MGTECNGNCPDTFDCRDCSGPALGYEPREPVNGEIEALRQRAEAAEKRVEELEDRQTAPVQGYAAGIPWDMHLRAYDVYCKRYGPQQALIQGDCRGGFHAEELDSFIPGWREALSERVKLIQRAENERLRAGWERENAEGIAASEDGLKALGIAKRERARAEQAEARAERLEKALRDLEWSEPFAIAGKMWVACWTCNQSYEASTPISERQHHLLCRQHQIIQRALEGE